MGWYIGLFALEVRPNVILGSSRTLFTHTADPLSFFSLQQTKENHVKVLVLVF